MEYLDYIRILLEIIGFFAILATQTENGHSDPWMDKAAKWINILGANVGKAKNR